MRTSKCFFAIVFALLGVSQVSMGQVSQQAAAECSDWFFNFPEGAQKEGTVLELTDQALRSPQNLRRGAEDTLKLVDNEQFRAALYGKKFTRLTLYLNRCTKSVEIVFDEVGKSPAAQGTQGHTVQTSSFAKHTPAPVTAETPQAFCDSSDQSNLEVLLMRHKGQKPDFQVLVQSGKLRPEDVTALESQPLVRGMIKSKDEFTLTYNKCTHQLLVMPGVATTTVKEEDTAAKGPSLKKTALNLGVSIFATGLMLSGGGPARMMLAAGLGGTPMLIEMLWKKFHHPQDLEPKPQVNSTIRYGDERGPISSLIPRIPQPPAARGTFRMKGNWWEKEW